jgi:hypothetical protein
VGHGFENCRGDFAGLNILGVVAQMGEHVLDDASGDFLNAFELARYQGLGEPVFHITLEDEVERDLLGSDFPST